MNNLDRCAYIFKTYTFYYHGQVNCNKGRFASYIKEGSRVNERQDLVLVDNWRLDNVWLEVI